MKYVLLFCLVATQAMAADAPPTVTLTQPELQVKISAVANAAAAQAVANYIAQEEATKVKGIDAKINEAFAPKPADAKK